MFQPSNASKKNPLSNRPFAAEQGLQGLHTFPIHPIGRFNGACASYKQPVEIMSFSYDDERNLHMDDRELKYYYPPDLNNCDLSHGYETYVQRENSGPEPIHSLLDALAHAKKLYEDQNLMRTDLVSWRGVFTKILCTPYNRNEPWELGATLWNIIVGFRDDNGFVKEIQELKTLEIPRMVRGKNGMWDATICLNFANEFFDWLKTIIVKNDPRSSYTITYKYPFKSIQVMFAGAENPVLAERHLESLKSDS
ncbi:17635_t:CDS:2 [Acaulospora colombiana]|uniref:17635_t:CDS:1 n=1 Tax=Acaulospora colombiana TaxID=27376 RepID=A0ACA9KK36_9GLOM|nr:17635_t:CDS:2 [Acaulospora colombiana]